MPTTKSETLLVFEGKICVYASVFLDHRLMSGLWEKKKAANEVAALEYMYCARVRGYATGWQCARRGLATMQQRVYECLLRCFLFPPGGTGSLVLALGSTPID